MATNTAALPLQTGTYFSRALQREQPYAWFAPPSWDGTLTEATPRYPLLVLLHGLGGGHQDWAQNTRIARYAAEQEMVIAFPDGGDGWYTNAVEDGPRCEDDLVQDFLPHLQATLPLLPPGKHWAIGGLSMGGYGALKIALKRPDLFLFAVSHSGALEQPKTPQPHPVFGDPNRHSAQRRAEYPAYLAELALCRWPSERPRLYFDCGESDALREENQRFADHLRFLGYPHTYREMPGYHTWPYWNRAFRTALPIIAQAIQEQR
jgi:S-formylglutathione hydrolase FrmB